MYNSIVFFISIKLPTIHLCSLYLLNHIQYIYIYTVNCPVFISQAVAALLITIASRTFSDKFFSNELKSLLKKVPFKKG